MVMVLTFDPPSWGGELRVGVGGARDQWRDPRTWRARRVAGDRRHMVSRRTWRPGSLSRRPGPTSGPRFWIPSQSSAMGWAPGMGR